MGDFLRYGDCNISDSWRSQCNCKNLSHCRWSLYKVRTPDPPFHATRALSSEFVSRPDFWCDAWPTGECSENWQYAQLGLSVQIWEISEICWDWLFDSWWLISISFFTRDSGFKILTGGSPEAPGWSFNLRCCFPRGWMSIELTRRQKKQEAKARSRKWQAGRRDQCFRSFWHRKIILLNLDPFDLNHRNTEAFLTAARMWYRSSGRWILFAIFWVVHFKKNSAGGIGPFLKHHKIHRPQALRSRQGRVCFTGKNLGQAFESRKHFSTSWVDSFPHQWYVVLMNFGELTTTTSTCSFRSFQGHLGLRTSFHVTHLSSCPFPCDRSVATTEAPALCQVQGSARNTRPNLGLGDLPGRLPPSKNRKWERRPLLILQGVCWGTRCWGFDGFLAEGETFSKVFLQLPGFPSEKIWKSNPCLASSLVPDRLHGVSDWICEMLWMGGCGWTMRTLYF